MLAGLMTSTELTTQIGAVNRQGRTRFKVPLVEALDRAHETKIGHREYASRLLLLLEGCETWLGQHGSSKFANRRRVVEKLRGQVRTLVAPIFAARQLADNEIASRRSALARTAQLEATARAEHMAFKRGPGEINDPRSLKSRAAFQQDVLAATIDRAKALKHDPQALDPRQVGYLAAKASLKVDHVLGEGVRQRCHVEAMRVLCAMLGKNRELANAFAASGIEVIVVPADRPMTDLEEFAAKRGADIRQASASSTRSWDKTRGIGGITVGSTVYVAITEENLLGTAITGEALRVGGGCYKPSYSTTSHEFAHVVHKFLLSTTQKTVITTAFATATGGVAVEKTGPTKFLRIPATLTLTGDALTAHLDTIFAREWVDGPRRMTNTAGTYQVAVGTAPGWRKLADGVADYTYASAEDLQDCYSAFNEREYFAQAVNCYLGTNAGKDPFTKRDRHNGDTWLRANEDRNLVLLLDELFAAGPHAYAQSRLPDTNTPEPPSLAVTIEDVLAAHRIRVANQRFGEAFASLAAIEWET